MALTVIKPSGIDTSGNYTVNGMNVSANLSVANLSVTTSLNLLTNSANLGPVGNVIITGGTEGYVLQTNGAGNLSWVAQSGGGSTSNISNGNSNVNIPTANGNINFSAVGNTTLIVTGTGANISGTLNTGSGVITGNGNGLSSLVGANVTGQVGNSLIAGTVYTNAQPNITSVGTLTSLTVTGNVTGGNLVTAGKVYASEMLNGGTGIYLSAGPAGYINFFTTGGDKASISDTGNIIASNLIANSTVFATTANISANVNAGNANLGNLVTANYLTGTLTTNAQPNVTSVGTLTDISVSGNGVFGGNLTVNGTLTYINSTTLSISDPIINLQTGPNGAAPVANTGKDVGTALNYYDTTAKIAWMGWDISNAEIAFGSNVGISSEVVTFTELANIRSGNAQLGNNVSANFFTGNGIYLTGITTAGVSNGNSNVNIPSANGNINFTAVGNTVMVVTGTGANISGTANITGNLTSGNANLGNTVSANFFTGTLTTAAQPNITSVGSLTGLTVSNATGVVDFTTTANVTLGAVGNLHISGGSANYVLQTDGSGTLSWVAQSGGGGGGASISNGNSSVNIPTANGNINFSAEGNANVVVITGTGANISGTANITGNVALSGANVTLGAVANLHISGGSNTYVLSTDGSGNLTWAAAAGTSIGVDNFTGNGVETTYTLTTTPANANATLVSIAGTFQPRTVYSLTGNVITFSSAPPNTAPIEVTTFTSGGGGGGGGITAQDLLSPFLLMGA